METTKSDGYVRILSLRMVPLVAALALVSGTSLFGQSYRLVELGGLGGENVGSSAASINNSGQIVGESTVLVNGLPRSHATLFSGTGADNIDLGTLGGESSHARAINDLGQIVGYSTLPGDLVGHATLFSLTGDNIDLGTLGGTFSAANAINNAGQIVGEAQIPGDRIYRATLFSGTGSGNTDLGDPILTGVPSSAAGINNAGQIVGSNRNGESRATLFVPGANNINLGTIQGGDSSAAFAINDAGLIVGVGNTAPGQDREDHAAIFPGMTNAIDLGVLPGHESPGAGRRASSVATSVNHAGIIVGHSSWIGIGGVGASSGVIRYPGSGWVPLPIDPNDINDWGQIVGTSGPKAALLNPVDPLTSRSGEATNIKFVGGMVYDRFTGASQSGGLQTSVAFLGGTAGTGGDGPYLKNRDVNLSFTPRGSNSLASDIVNLSGTAGPTFADTIVLQLTYDEATAVALFGSESAARLGWFDPLANQWSLAVAGNTGGSPFFAGDRAYNPLSDSVLGHYGVDTANNTVWAVINHNSDFAVVPEPSTSILIGLGLFLTLNRLRARTTRA